MATAAVAYEEPGDNFARHVEEILAKLGSPDPRGDMLSQSVYVQRAKAAGLHPETVASTIYILEEQRRSVGRPPRGERLPVDQTPDKIWWSVSVHDTQGVRRTAYVRAANKTEAIKNAHADLRAEGHTPNPRFGWSVRMVEGSAEEAVAAADCSHTHPPEVPATPCVPAEDCHTCKHSEPLKRNLRWHRAEDDGFFADSSLGKFHVTPQKPNRRVGVHPWLLRLETVEIRSFDYAAEAKSYAQAYGEIVPSAAAGESVGFSDAGKVNARPIVGGRPIVEACRPWVRVTRDPEAFKGCLAIAEQVGPIDSGKKVHEIVGPYLLKEDQEVYLVILLDVHDKLRGIVEVARGQRSRVVVDASDILRPVIITGASSFYAWHQHPSGSADPSSQDRRLTRHIAEAAKSFPEVTFKGHGVSGANGFKMA